MGLVEQLSRPLIGLVAIVALLLLAWKVLKTSPSLPPAVTGASGSLEPQVAGDQELPTATTTAHDPAALLRSRLDAATEKPELAAQVVRAWLGGS